MVLTYSLYTLDAFKDSVNAWYYYCIIIHKRIKDYCCDIYTVGVSLIPTYSPNSVNDWNELYWKNEDTMVSSITPPIT